jgi:hypothetical protein
MDLAAVVQVSFVPLMEGMGASLFSPRRVAPALCTVVGSRVLTPVVLAMKLHFVLMFSGSF